MNTVKISIDGVEYQTEAGKTILEVCRGNQIEIPTLCYSPALEPYGSCRLCVVEIEKRGRKSLQTACTYPVSNDMIVNTKSERIWKSRRLSLELLLSRCPGEPKLQELAAAYGVETQRFAPQKEDCILCGLCVRMCKKIGSDAIGFQNRGYDKKVTTPGDAVSNDCITCGACSFICPTSHFSENRIAQQSGRELVPNVSEFDQGLRNQGNIAIYFTQAVPNLPVIDRENCVRYLTGGCGICETACAARAIDYDENDEELELNVGSVVFSAGFEEFNPKILYKYGYQRIPNVVTSIEFERILSASGPFAGQVIRPSDHTHPERIAFLQCIGSRDEKNDLGYCSSVCCMYAIKEAVIAKEHAGSRLETTIFYMDLRCYGKDFEKYYERAKNEYGVQFVKTKAYEVSGVAGNENLVLRYSDFTGKVLEAEFDLVVLSVGLRPSVVATGLAEQTSLSLNEYGFIKSRPFDPTQTFRDGIYSCGVMSGPKDIPETVVEASAASGHINELLHQARNSLTRQKTYPVELDLSGRAPRIGVFVCHCGINIAGVVDVKAVADFARTLPNVVYVENNLYTCSQDTQELMKKLIREHNLTRVVVASCSPRTHEPLFQETIRETGMNKHLFEMANIRDQCSWVHMREPEQATEKAKDLVKMAVYKARLAKPLAEVEINVLNSALVIGGGVAGMNASLNLASQGLKVYLIERKQELGGLARQIQYDLEKRSTPQYVADLILKVENHPAIEVLTEAELAEISGYVGNFKSGVKLAGQDSLRRIEHGAIIVTVGGEATKPAEYLYGQSELVLTQLELEGNVSGGRANPKDWSSVVMIQCVGSREPEKPYCSRFCCQQAIKNAIKVKELNPACEIYVLYREIRTYGLKEQYYRQAREMGVIFIHYDIDRKPGVALDKKGGLEVKVYEKLAGKELLLHPNRLILSAGMNPPSGNHELASLLKVPLNSDGFFLEAHVKLMPVDFATEGIFLAGACHSPKTIEESIAQGYAAASHAGIILNQERLTLEGMVSRVDPLKCNACGMCEEVCPYKAVEVTEQQYLRKTITAASIKEAVCKGCGVCSSVCPSGAIDLKGFSNESILEQIKAGVND
jgi:heterodisulfide reductase subunit A2